MKSVYKWLLGLVVVIACVGVGKVWKVEAHNVYVPYFSSEVNGVSQYVDRVMEFNYCYVTYEEYSVTLHALHYVFCNDVRIEQHNGVYYLCPYDYERYTVFTLSSDYGNTPTGGSYFSGYDKYESSVTSYGEAYKCSAIVASNWDWRGDNAELSDYTVGGLDYPQDLMPSLPTISVNVIINGTEYTISESYPYYFAFKDSNGYIELLFSDIPFTGSLRDMYTTHFTVDDSATVVSYYFNPVYQNDFISSRTVTTNYGSIGLKSPWDYMCNYPIYNTNVEVSVFLPEKNSFDFQSDYTLDDLSVNFPEELKEYQCFIIFRQTSDKAYDDRIIFYGWNDISAELYINGSNSQICAIRNNKAVSDYVTAYYDEDSSTWVISNDVVLGATTDFSYHVPKIYYTTTTLFLSDSAWKNTGDVVETFNFYPPPFSEDVEDSEEDSDEGLLDRFLRKALSGNTNLLKYLFIPSEGYFSTQLSQLQSYFGFWTSVRDTADVFMNFLKNTDFTEPPKIEIDLSLAKTSVNYGGKVYLIDLSWYEPYKESVDVILSSILWLVFIWNTYKNLPNIIAGIGGGVQASASLFDDGKEE